MSQQPRQAHIDETVQPVHRATMHAQDQTDLRERQRGQRQPDAAPPITALSKKANTTENSALNDRRTSMLFADRLPPQAQPREAALRSRRRRTRCAPRRFNARHVEGVPRRKQAAPIGIDQPPPHGSPRAIDQHQRQRGDQHIAPRPHEGARRDDAAHHRPRGTQPQRPRADGNLQTNQLSGFNVQCSISNDH